MQIFLHSCKQKSDDIKPREIFFSLHERRRKVEFLEGKRVPWEPRDQCKASWRSTKGPTTPILCQHPTCVVLHMIPGLYSSFSLPCFRVDPPNGVNQNPWFPRCFADRRRRKKDPSFLIIKKREIKIRNQIVDVRRSGGLVFLLLLLLSASSENAVYKRISAFEGSAVY